MGHHRAIVGAAGVLIGLFAAGCSAGAKTTGAGGGGGTGGSGGSGGSGGTGTGGTVTDRVVAHDASGRPAAGIDVVLHDASGAPTGTTKTNAEGIAEIELTEGGGVTVLWRAATTGNNPDYQAVSVLGLSSISEIEVVADPYVEHALQPPMTLSFTGEPPLVAADWNVEASCREDMMVGEYDFQYEGCPSSDTFDVFVHFNPWDTWQVFPAQAVEPGASLPYKLDLAMAQPAPLVSVFATLPAEVNLFSAGLYGNRPEGGRNIVSRSHDPQMPPGPTHDLPRVLVAEGGTIDLVLSASILGGLPMGYRRRIPLDPVPDSYDWTVPDLALVTSAGPVSGDPARPEVAWQLAGTGSAGDVVRVELSYDVQEGASAHFNRWTIYTPYAASGTVQFPQLPPEMSSFQPAPGASGTVLVEHIAVDPGDTLLDAVNAEHDRVDTSLVWSSDQFQL
jgi:hypothetical protein